MATGIPRLDEIRHAIGPFSPEELPDVVAQYCQAYASLEEQVTELRKVCIDLSHRAQARSDAMEVVLLEIATDLASCSGDPNAYIRAFGTRLIQRVNTAFEKMPADSTPVRKLTQEAIDDFASALTVHGARSFGGSPRAS